MKQRMAALTALCLTGTLLLSGGWSQTVLASTVSDVTSGSALDGTPDAADDTQPADGGQEEAPADGQEAPVADEPEAPEGRISRRKYRRNSRSLTSSCSRMNSFRSHATRVLRSTAIFPIGMRSRR